MNRQDRIIWAAGFIDGEGYIGVEHKQIGGEDYFCLRLEVNQKTIEPLLLLQEIWGGSLRWRPARAENRAAQWVWRAAAKASGRVALDIEPYVCVKRLQVAVAKAFLRLGRYQGRSVPAHVQDTRRALYWAMKKANTTGPKHGEHLTVEKWNDLLGEIAESTPRQLGLDLNWEDWIQGLEDLAR